jgi:hypothetical protein
VSDVGLAVRLHLADAAVLHDRRHHLRAGHARAGSSRGKRMLYVMYVMCE